MPNIWHTSILLDSQLTVHAFCNADFMEKIWTSPQQMTLLGNGGEITTNQQCSIRGLDVSQVVWFYAEYTHHRSE